MQLYFIRHGESGNNALYAKNGDSKGRSQDPELTGTGRKQALHLAIHLMDAQIYRPSNIMRRFKSLQDGFSTGSAQGITHLYCSLMVRAVVTGNIVAEAAGLSLTAWQDLHEAGGIYLEQEGGQIIEGGIYPAVQALNRSLRVGLPGKTRSYFQERFPHFSLPNELDEQGWWNRPYETDQECSQRAERVLEKLIQDHGALRSDGSEDRVALISHGGFYNHLMRAVLRMPSLKNDEIDDVWFELNNTAVTRIDYFNGRFLVLYHNKTDFLPAELIT